MRLCHRTLQRTLLQAASRTHKLVHRAARKGGFVFYAYDMEQYISPDEPVNSEVQQPVSSRSHRKLLLSTLLAVIVLGTLGYMYYASSLETDPQPLSIPALFPENSRIEHATYLNDRYGITLDYPQDHCLSVWVYAPETTAPKDFVPGTISSAWAGNVHYTDEANTRHLNGEDTAESICVRSTEHLTLHIRDHALNPEPPDSRAEDRETAGIFMASDQLLRIASQLAAAPVGDATDIPGLTDSALDSEVLVHSIITTKTGKAVVLATRDHFTGSKEGDGIFYYFHTFSDSGDLITGNYSTGVKDDSARTVTGESILDRKDWEVFKEIAASFSESVQ